MAHKVILPPKKNYIPQFLKQRDINSYKIGRDTWVMLSNIQVTGYCDHSPISGQGFSRNTWVMIPYTGICVLWPQPNIGAWIGRNTWVMFPHIQGFGFCGHSPIFDQVFSRDPLSNVPHIQEFGYCDHSPIFDQVLSRDTWVMFPIYRNLGTVPTAQYLSWD